MLSRVVLGALVTTSLACGTIIHGTTQNVGLSSTPTGARVFVDNKELGVTPIVAQLSRKDNHIVRFQLDGYAPFEATVTRQTSGWVWGNIVFGGLIGLAVDAISGGLYKLTPEQIAGQLNRADVNGDDCYVFVVMRPDPSWTKIGELARP
jgi:hypothetical protein